MLWSILMLSMGKGQDAIFRSQMSQATKVSFRACLIILPQAKRKQILVFLKYNRQVDRILMETKTFSHNNICQKSFAFACHRNRYSFSFYTLPPYSFFRCSAKTVLSIPQFILFTFLYPTQVRKQWQTNKYKVSKSPSQQRPKSNTE